MFKHNVNDITENKLILLFTLAKTNIPLTNTQITEIVMTDSLMNYFVLQQYLVELVNIGQIKISERDDKQVYELSDEGRVTLSYFENRIPFNIREKLQLIILKKIREFKNSSEIIGDYMPVNKNEYMVDCKIIERDIPLIELKFTVGTKQEAKNICEKWKKDSQKIYSNIISIFTQDT